MTTEDDPVATFTVTTFTPYLGEVFRLGRAEAGGVETQLIEAQSHGGGAGREQFSLVFRGPADVVLPQAIYRLEHETLGAFELFVVPIGPDGQGMRYEAVFG